MAIEGGMRDKLATGTKLVAKYRGTQYIAELVATADGKVHFRLADGREFKSPSAAGSAVMGGVACNGWPCGMELHAGTDTRCAQSPLSSAHRPYQYTR